MEPKPEMSSGKAGRPRLMMLRILQAFAVVLAVLFAMAWLAKVLAALNRRVGTSPAELVAR